MLTRFRFTLLIFALAPALAHAQVTIPRNVEASTVEEQIENREMPRVAPIPEKGYRPIVVPKGADKAMLVLKELIIDGVKIYPPEKFRPLYDGLIGKKISLAEIYAVADHIRQIYHDDGYVLTQVFLPEQDIKNGIVRIQVMEGYVSSLRWDGASVSANLVRDMAAEITRSRPFNSKTLESVMLRLNGLPGIQARAALEPLPQGQAAPGEVGLAITLERKRADGSVSVDNYASRYLDVFQGIARANIYGLASDIDSVSITGSSSIDPARMRYGALQYNLPVHASGTTLFAGGSLSNTHPGFQLAILDIFSSSQSWYVGVAQPLLRSRTESLDVTAQFTHRNQQTDVLEQLFSEDRIRTASVNGRYNFSDAWDGANLISLELSQGLDVMNASRPGEPRLSRTSGSGQFTKLTAELARLQTIDDDFSVLVAAIGQKASTSLLSSEQFGFGGSRFGRGYDASEISGDEGMAAAVELRWNAYREDLWAVQPYGFYDIGVVQDKQPNADPVSAASAGLGLRVQWDQVSFEGNVAFPLTYTPATPKFFAENKDPRFNLQLGLAF